MAESEIISAKPGEAELAAEEFMLKREEYAARREEARAKLKTAAVPRWRTADPLVLAVTAGVLTLVGNTLLAYLNTNATNDQEKTKATNALDVEKEKAKATLILQAVATDDPATARRNLLFFLDSGLIKDSDQKIRTAVEKYAPVLPSVSGQPTRTPPTSPESYSDFFWRATVRPEWTARVDSDATRIINAKSRLELVAQAAHTPWYVIGVFWLLETGGSFTVHLHNGDPLTNRTRNLPVGHPEIWPPPAGTNVWEYSATDALTFYKLNNLEGLQIGEVLGRLEIANGRGYQKRGLFSPYLWNGTDLYEKGRYVSDGQFSSEATSRQVGAVAVLRRLQERNIVDLHPVATASTPPR